MHSLAGFRALTHLATSSPSPSSKTPVGSHRNHIFGAIPWYRCSFLWEIEMVWDLGNSNDYIRRDIARWRQDLAMWAAAGMGNSSPAVTIRVWIAEAEWMIKPLA